MEVGDSVIQKLFLSDAFRVFGDGFEEERDLGAVLHGSDEQVSQLQSLAALVRLAPLQPNVT